jgi:hypothetical protein
VPGGIGFTTGFEQAGSGFTVPRTNELTMALANYVSGQTTTTQRLT